MELEDIKTKVWILAEAGLWEDIFNLLHKEFNYGASVNKYPNDLKSFDLGIKEEDGE